jgi:hypothetical protein
MRSIMPFGTVILTFGSSKISASVIVVFPLNVMLAEMRNCPVKLPLKVVKVVGEKFATGQFIHCFFACSFIGIEITFEWGGGGTGVASKAFMPNISPENRKKMFFNMRNGLKSETKEFGL